MVLLQAALLAAVLGGAGNTVLLDFYADWCGPCQQMHPVVDQLAAAGHPVRKVNVDQEKELAARFQVRGIPCFVLLVNGQEVDRVVGATSRRRLEGMFQQAAQNNRRPKRDRGPLGLGLLPARRHPADPRIPKPRLGRGQSPDAPMAPVVMPGVRMGDPLAGGEAPPFNPPRQAAPPVKSPQAAMASHSSRADAGAADAQAWQNVAAPAAADAPTFSAPNTPRVSAQAVPPAPQIIPSATPETPKYKPAARVAVAQPAGRRNMDRREIQTRLMQASVRIRVEDPNGNSVGSGTIIDSEGDQALVVTCGHIFRDSQGKGHIVVDLFGPGQPRRVEGQLIDYDLKADVGLVCIESGGPVTVADVARSAGVYTVGQPVINIGCNHGEDPTLRESRITSLNKYLGPARIVVAGQPVEGRSGGGLFTSEGQLIGICDAADPQDDEGLYAALPLIHAELDREQLAHVYLGDGPDEAAGALASVVPPSMPGSMPDGPSNRESASNGAMASSAAGVGFASPSIRRLAETDISASTAGRKPPAGLAAASSGLGARKGRSEVICVIRTLDDSGDKPRIVVIHEPSSALLDQLAAESEAQQPGHLTSLDLPRRANPLGQQHAPFHRAQDTTSTAAAMAGTGHSIGR